MGCGSSTAGSASAPGLKVERDVDDLYLDGVVFEKLNIPPADRIFADAAAPVNQVVDWCNGLLHGLYDIKDAAADIAGAFKIEVKEAPDSYRIFVRLHNADGTDVLPTNALGLLAKPEVKMADMDFAVALAQLQQRSNLALKEHEGKILSDTPVPELDAFNGALEAFKALSGLNVKLDLKPPVAAGAQTLSIFVFKAVYRELDSPRPEIVPVTPLEIYSKDSAKEFLSAWEAVVQQSKALAFLTEGTQVTFKLVKGRIAVTAASADEKKAAALANASKNFNAQLFKLQKAAFSVNGELNLIRAMKLVYESMVQKVKKVAGEGVENPVTLVPKFNLNADLSIDFDLGMRTSHGDFQEFPACLPTAAQRVWKIFVELLQTIKSMVGGINKIKNQVMKLINDCSSLPAKIPQMAMAAGLNPMDGMKAGKRIVNNIKALSNFTANIDILFAILKKIGEELKSCVQGLMNL